MYNIIVIIIRLNTQQDHSFHSDKGIRSASETCSPTFCLENMFSVYTKTCQYTFRPVSIFLNEDARFMC